MNQILARVLQNYWNYAISKAWKIIKRAQEDLGYELVHTTSGGSLGGGSQLTLEGKELVRKYKLFQEKIEMYSEQVFKEVFENE